MKDIMKWFLLVLGVFLFSSSSGLATQYEYSDAPVPYGTAWHTTDTWQKLGSAWDSESDAKRPDLDLSDDGVWWSVDGGSNWGHDDVYAGQTIKIRVDLWSAGFGNHDYDQVKLWADLNQDYAWDNNINTELIIAEQFWKPANMIVDDTKPFTPGPDAVTSFYADLLIADNMIGDLWLRARASCWDTPFGSTTPYGHLWQGEVEDWKITVNANPVPEPATMLLLGTGLIGLAGVRRKQKK